MDDHDGQLHPAFAEQATRMPAIVRSLIVDNAEATSCSANDLLRALGLPEIRAPPPGGGAALRSLALLDLLPRSVGSTTDVKHVERALGADACARLRDAVDASAASAAAAADSVDGCPDHQLNLSQEELWRLIGESEAARLWRLAGGALEADRAARQRTTMALARGAV
eukprot:4984939-Prymnesium_polylepis.1